MDLSPAILYTDAAPQLAETLLHVHITEHDPAIILNWHMEALQALVARAITIDSAPDPPLWLRTWPSTVTSLTEDIVAFLAQVAGGRFGIVVLAPNTMYQAFNIWTRIRDIEVDPFMQRSCTTRPTPCSDCLFVGQSSSAATT